MRKLGAFVAVAAVAGLLLAWCGGSDRGDGKATGGRGARLRLATTTSVRDSGLLAELLPAFERQSGYRVEVEAVGSGKAIERLRSGAADVAITHAPSEEHAAVAAGAASRRLPFMHNDFVLVGPPDAAKILAGAADIRDALARVRGSRRPFFSRADGSGTHQREQALWTAAGIAPQGEFVVAVNAGMGDTLARASKEQGFTLVDRSTFLAKRDGLKLAILFQGDDELRNTYSVLEPQARGADAAGARALAEFVRSPEGRALIGGFGVAKLGEPLFTPEE